MINEQIRDKEVRLIGHDGAQLGVVPGKDAQERAIALNLDLVKISPKAVPPVCKIMDYGKYKFELSKKDKEARKNQKVVLVKEIRLSSGIDDHDFDTKVNHAAKFLQAGDKVKVSLRFRGREITHASLGEQVLNRFKQAVEEYGTVDKRPAMEGRSMSIFIMPITSKT